MKFDLGVLAGILVFSLVGASTGGMRQIAAMVGYAAGWFGARPLAALLTPLAVAEFHYSPGLTRAVLSLALFSVLAAVAGKLAKEAYIRMFDGPDGEKTDRKFGFFIGAIKSTLIAYVLVGGYLVFKGGPDTPGMFGPAEQDSEAQAFIAVHNVFDTDTFSAAVPIRQLLEVRRNGGEMTPAALAELLKDPEFRAAVSNANDAANPKSAEMQEILNDPQVQKMLSDPKLKELLLSSAGGKKPL